ncbi:flagellar export protein FliJ [Aliivibrio fischeri]|uniref:flagellar export protein FliJ n=1 Tax=Aliivibrio fischeri TaxID=668 RepID=UPI0007C4CF76|nr:flagellar export protein FliJ [Aliivibrio fischeri]MCE7554588.1 flagella biosynthesis chaperone FliJ [Aliivibrio fischeri]MCE7561856.1 flagella biosynthesis chaperone FliJ [Aliivibrio fischeri]MCE7569264.1 flagella biosynthesis chaperone FliJ [Aliivibrio fischeri]
MTSTFNFLLEQAQERENQAVMALNKAKAELEDFYEQVKQIEKYRLDYCNQLLQRGQQGLTASQYGHLNKFLVQLDETLTKQKSAESHFTSQVDNCQTYWQETRKQRRSYEWMMDKKKAERQKMLDKQEQKMMDEFSTLQFARRSKTE